LTALAVMIALVGAMFVTLAPTSAQVTGALDACALVQAEVGDQDNDGNSNEAAVDCERTIPGTGTIDVVYQSGKLGVATATVSARTVTFAPSTAAEGDDDIGTAVYRVIAGNTNGVTLGEWTVSVTTRAFGTSATAATTPNPSFKITFVGDADDIVKAGSRVIVRVTSDGDADLASVSAQSLSFFAKRTAYTADGDDADDDPDVAVSRIFVGPVLQSGVTFPADTPVTRTFDNVATGQCLTSADGEACDPEVETEDLGDEGTEKVELELFVPAGTTAGAYAITAGGTRSDSDSTPLSSSKALTVGTQVEVDTVVFDLSSPRRMNIPVHIAGQAQTVLNPDDEDKTGGGAKGDQPDGYADDASTREPAAISIGTGNNTELTLSVLNASGKPAEAGAVTSIVISTTGGTLTDNSGAATYSCEADNTHACEIDFSTYRSAGDPLPGKIRVLLTAPVTPGSGSVSVVVVAGGKVFTADPVDVTFYGPASELTIGDASGSVLAYNVGDDEETDYDPKKSADKGMDARDQISFTVDAVDKNGNAVRTPGLVVTIKDPDGTTVARGKFDDPVQSTTFNNKLSLDVDTAATSPLAVGVYSIEVKSGALKDSSTLTVVSAADSVELALDNDAPTEVGQDVMASVTVTDTEGNPVADGTVVSFRASDLTGDDDAVVVLDATSAPTSAGEASVALTVVGHGRAVIRATVSDDTTPVRDTAVLSSTAGAPEVVEEEPEEASVACLSNLNGFATWTCSVESSASEIFGLVSGRGATAIHLWNGSAWVRYSVVDGTMVPGSSDFMVAENDILYISN